MFRRHRSHLLLSMALLAPSLLSTLARAQGSADSPSAAAATPAAPPPAAPAAPASSRPPLVPATTPSPASSPSAAAADSGSTISPSRDQRDLAAQGAQRPSAGELVGSPQE